MICSIITNIAQGRQKVNSRSCLYKEKLKKVDEKYKQDGPQLRNLHRQIQSFQRVNILLFLLTATIGFSLSADA